MWRSQTFSTQATNYICQKRLIQDQCTGQYLKHSPVQTADNVGMPLVLEDQDLIQSLFPVLLFMIYFLHGHLKGHWRPLTGEGCETTTNMLGVFLELCQTALGRDTRAQSVTFPAQGTHGQRHLALEALEKWSLLHHPQSSNNVLCTYNLLKQP